MKWFEGDIPTAVNTAKTRGALFVVYVSGQDDLSKEMDRMWDDSTVTALCEQGCVALKIPANSETCVQFSAIYPVVVVPCTYFINGGNGVPLEVAAGVVEAEAFVEKIRAVLENHKAQTPAPQASTSTPAPTAQASAPAEQTSAPAEQASAPEEQAPAPAQVTQDASVPSTSAAAAAAAVEDKVERAKELIAKKREEKARKESEESKSKEKERRDIGKQMGQVKEWKEDMKRKEEASEWKKDREEAKQARERVREQIARDREERAVRFQKEKEERAQTQQQKHEMKDADEAETAAKQAADRMQKARLQFRFPNGSSLTQEFTSSETLQTACDFLRAKVGNTYGNFVLKTTFPKRQFTEADMSQTLLDLQLAPSAAILVLPGSRTVATTSPGGGGGGSDDGLLWSLLAPLLALWNFIYTFLFGGPREPRGASATGAPQPGTSTAQSESTKTSQQTQQQQRRQQQQQRSTRPKSSYGVRGRKEGNIHRFSADDEDDDDMSTWNGNSTQQL